MSVGKTIIGRNTPSRIGEPIASENARLTFPFRRISQSHSSQSRSSSETRRAPALQRRKMRPLIRAFTTTAHAPAIHSANDRLKTIGFVIEGLTLSVRDGG